MFIGSMCMSVCQIFLEAGNRCINCGDFCVSLSHCYPFRCSVFSRSLLALGVGDFFRCFSCSLRSYMDGMDVHRMLCGFVLTVLMFDSVVAVLTANSSDMCVCWCFVVLFVYGCALCGKRVPGPETYRHMRNSNLCRWCYFNEVCSFFCVRYRKHSLDGS